MPYGYMGKILHVDLTTGGMSVEEPSDEIYRTYFGGSALGIYYLFRRTPAGADPLGPDNTLAFMVSPLTGLPFSGQSRANATAKSPMSGLIGDGQAGGYWPAELKFAGFDGIVITGRSPRPVYLWIKNGVAELRDAAHLWGGRTTGDVEAAIKQELGDDKVEVAQIGPAGERGVRFANIINMSNRKMGRTGMGAVMASKNLKAVVLRGRGKVVAADPATIARLSRLAPRRVEENPDMKALQDFGSACVMNYQNMMGGQPTRNYTSGVFEHAEAISGETMAATILKKTETCYACVVKCKRVVETSYKGRRVDPLYGGPEYETLSTFGSFCGNGDINAVALAHQICDENGMDTITCGATIAFAMDCFERGILTLADTGGIDLRFGNADAMLAVVEKIARREGIGDLLSNGSERAAEMIGRGAQDLVVAVKNNELPAHMPQVKRSLAVIFAVNPFGADHQSSEHDPYYAPETPAMGLEKMAQIGLTDPQPERALTPEKVKFALYTQRNYSFMDTAGLCQFVLGPGWQVYGPQEMVDLTNAATGWNWTIADMQRMGERRINMMRAFNAREGAGRGRDTLPKRLFEPLKGGVTDGVSLDRAEFEAALDEYYRLSGWDVATGLPTRAKLEELGLGWMAQP